MCGGLYALAFGALEEESVGRGQASADREADSAKKRCRPEAIVAKLQHADVLERVQ